MTVEILILAAAACCICAAICLVCAFICVRSLRKPRRNKKLLGGWTMTETRLDVPDHPTSGPRLAASESGCTPTGAVEKAGEHPRVAAVTPMRRFAQYHRIARPSPSEEKLRVQT